MTMSRRGPGDTDESSARLSSGVGDQLLVHVSIVGEVEEIPDVDGAAVTGRQIGTRPRALAQCVSLYLNSDTHGVGCDDGITSANCGNRSFEGLHSLAL